jgi:hypothetical protein
VVWPQRSCDALLTAECRLLSKNRREHGDLVFFFWVVNAAHGGTDATEEDPFEERRKLPRARDDAEA